MTKTADIRRAFLDYFKSEKHKILPSGPLVPANDASLMFANAGMVQFKDYFVGTQKPKVSRVATVQKCIRISGKHNDLENVGPSSRHHTFFEMLGNFSFGDYFKEHACRFGWELLTQGFGLDPDRLWITVFCGDDSAPADKEAESIWRDQIGVPTERIVALGAKDNFWAMGDTGPCGPCSEIHFDRGPDFGPKDIQNGERFFELWNLVFMQYFVAQKNGPMTPLPSPCIDTGAGLERIASVLQKVDSNYHIDIFKPLVEKAAAISGKSYGENESDDVSMRVIADHARMTAFLVAEGVFPEKTAKEYVLRRVMRRAVRHGHRLGIGDLFLHRVADEVVQQMHDAYPELAEHRDLIDKVCRLEEERFRETLERGLELLKENTNWNAAKEKTRKLPGDIAFRLTATYGFPKDLIEVIGEEEGFVLDKAGYARAETDHKSLSGAGKIGEKAVKPIYGELKSSVGETAFAGYDSVEGSGQVLAVVRDGRTQEQAEEGDRVEVILDETPFYGEAGGQVGDTGVISCAGGAMKVADTQVPIPGLIVHKGEIYEGRIRVADQVQTRVNHLRRDSIRRHHTATHLLHMALRKVLGNHATQKGSRVEPQGLRFDFAHFEPLTQEQKLDVEEIVAVEVRNNHPVATEQLPIAVAKERGAIALFGENYGEAVRMVTVSTMSKELCGGIHVASSGDIGHFFIVSEMGIAAGVRRIEAVAGQAALNWIRSQREILLKTANLLKVAPEGLLSRTESLVTRERELVKEVASLKRKLAGGGRNLLDEVREINGIRVLGAKLEVGDPGALRDTVDSMRQKIASGVVCLGGENNGKAALIVAVTPDLTQRIKAGDLIREVAKVVGGSGGGRPDFAQAGGPDASKLDDAVAMIYKVVEKALAKPENTK